MSIQLKTINNEVVRPVRYQNTINADLRPIKGANLFSELYANIFIVAKKKSGKTTVLYKIVKDCTTFETTVMVFSSTVDKDNNHLAIKQYCNVHKIPYVSYTSIKDEDIDVLDTLIHKLQEDAKIGDAGDSDDDSSSENEQDTSLVLFDSDDEDAKEKEVKSRKAKYIAPEYLIILDDLSNELKNKTLVRLMKMNRHFKMKIVLSTQYYLDTYPEVRKQIDVCMIFKGETEAKLLAMHKDFDLAIDFETFKQIYHNATNKPYGFLYIDIRSEQYRKNFNMLYEMKPQQ